MLGEVGKYLGTKSMIYHSSKKVLLLATVTIISALWSLILQRLNFALTKQECQAAFKCWPKLCAVCLIFMIN